MSGSHTQKETMMHGFYAAAAVAVCLMIAPAVAGNTTTLICKCKSVVVNGDVQRGCAGQSDRTAVIDFDQSTLQWSNGAGYEWPAIEANITDTTIKAGIDPSKPRNIPGKLMISFYTINRITGEFEEDGMGHFRHPSSPNIDSIVPADVTGVCTKVDAPKF
jgi:hypothetical protein